MVRESNRRKEQTTALEHLRTCFALLELRETLQKMKVRTLALEQCKMALKRRSFVQKAEDKHSCKTACFSCFFCTSGWIAMIEVVNHITDEVKFQANNKPIGTVNILLPH